MIVCFASGNQRKTDTEMGTLPEQCPCEANDAAGALGGGSPQGPWAQMFSGGCCKKA